MNKQATKRATRLVCLLLALLLVSAVIFSAAAQRTYAAETTQAATEAAGTTQAAQTQEAEKWGVTDYIKAPFAYLLEWLYNLTSNYGLALILFAIVVKILLFPASAMSKKSTMKMSRLTPKVKALEAKYGDDKAKYQAEVNKLYKEEGAGGCTGCLWTALPLLILIPLYAIIREPITWLMLHGDFGKVTEVSKFFAANGVDVKSAYWQMNAMTQIKNYLPQLQQISPAIRVMNTSFLGIELSTVPQWKIWTVDVINWSAIGQFLLPLVSGGANWFSMWLAQKMNNKVIVNDKGEQDEQMAKANQTSKTMTMMMPIMSIVFGFMMPAGMSIYWIIQALISVVQDSILTKHYKKVYDAEDAIKQERAAREAAEEAERERIRAEKRAANPEGITTNTSKKRLQQKQKAEQAAKEAAYQAQLAAREGEELPSEEDKARPNRRGRNYDPNRYKEDTDNEE